MVIAMVNPYFKILTIIMKLYYMLTIMNQMTPSFEFTSAYRQLRPSEKVFVDGYVSDLESIAVRTGEKLQALLNRPLLDHADERSLSMLSLSLVRAAIAERVKELSEEMELSVYKTLKELRSLAYSNIGNYMEVGIDGFPSFSLEHCTPEQLAAVKSIKIEEGARGGRKFEFTLHDKVSSLDKVMKYQGLLDDEHWRSENVKATNGKQLDANTSVDEAAGLYARLING